MFLSGYCQEAKNISVIGDLENSLIHHKTEQMLDEVFRSAKPTQQFQAKIFVLNQQSIQI